MLIVDANTYSCGELFTAGFVDHAIGPVVSLGTATGAGAANVWSDADLPAAIRATGRRIPPLPDGFGFTMSVRRMVRTGASDGMVIEGVA